MRILVRRSPSPSHLVATVFHRMVCTRTDVRLVEVMIVLQELNKYTYYFGIVEEAFLHDFGCAEFISPNENVDMRAVFCKV